MYAKKLRCVQCGNEYDLDPNYLCRKCGGILDVVYEYDEHLIKTIKEKRRVEDVSAILPVKKENYINIGQGNTALIKTQRLAEELEIEKLYLKCEFQNPTGSFKDRPVSIGISKAVEFGYKKVVVASTGNGAAAVSAFAARAGLEAIIFVPELTTTEKMKQAAYYGSKVFRVQGPYSESFKLAKEVGIQSEVFNLTTTFINPYTIDGDKLIAYELFEQLDGEVPDVIFIPIGAGPLLVGIYKGYKELQKMGLTNKVPRMAGIQAAGCSTIARAFLEGRDEVESVDQPSTVAGGICDGLKGYSQDGTYTLKVIKESGGFALNCDDESILKSQHDLARYEGVFVEPSSAAALAGLSSSIQKGLVNKNDMVVSLLTGHGLKDGESIQLDLDIPSISNDIKEIERINI